MTRDARTLEMIVKLHEIPAEGLHLEVDQTHQEMASALSDLLPGKAFKVVVDILDIGDGFDVKGKVEANYPLTCSFCANDYDRPILERFHEIIMAPEKTKHKMNDKVGDLTDPDMNVITVEDGDFQFGEFIREIIGLTEPLQPPCKEIDRETCIDYMKFKQEFGDDCEEAKNMSSSPFSALSKLKLN